MSAAYDPEEAEEWIEKVNLVQQTIRDLGSNNPDALAKADNLLNKFAREKRGKTQKNKSESSSNGDHKSNKWRKGDGWKNEYKYYCNKCFTEILISTSQCPRCNYNKLITRKERRNILQSRVNTLKHEYDLKEKRHKRWEEYRKLHAKNECNLTNYAEWELWEDEIDWNDYMNDNYIPDNNPSFKAMAYDMQQRSEKRNNEMKAAIKEKTCGNKYLKEKNYSQAIVHYTNAIEYRRDYKALYTNRALAYMKLGRYDKCIDDCSIVIDMIQYIDLHEQKSDIIFKAYLRRANAYQLLGQLRKAQSDIMKAIELRPKQKDAIQLKSTIDLLVNDEMMREKIQKEILSDRKLTNFDNALRLTLDYFKMSNEREVKDKKGMFEDKTPFDKKMDKWNSEKPCLLFGKLLGLVSCKHEYAVRFADNNGLYLGFKYLERELLLLQNEMKELKEYSVEMVDKQKGVLHMKQLSLSKLCKLLIYITSYKHNKLLISRNDKLIVVIIYCIYYIILSFEQYNDMLSIESIHLSSICCEIGEIRDMICNNGSYSKLFYENINEYLLYSPPNNNKLQILQYLFDFLENLFGNDAFINVSVSIYNPSDIVSNPHIYVALFNYLSKYCNYVHSARMGQEEMMKFEIKQSVVSSILTAMATLFGPNENIISILMSDNKLYERISILKTHLIHLNRMFIQFEEKNPLKNMNQFGGKSKMNVKISRQQTEQVLNKLYEKHQLNISQIAKVITVFMSLSHHKILHNILIKLEIHEILFDLLPYVRYIDYKNIQYANILSLARDHIINYFDQISNNKKFDKIINDYNKQCNPSIKPHTHKTHKELPAFWTFITDIINRRSFIKNNVSNDIDKPIHIINNHNTKQSTKSQKKNNRDYNNRRGRHKNKNNIKKQKEKQKAKEANKAIANHNKLMEHLNNRRDADHKTNYNVTYSFNDTKAITHTGNGIECKDNWDSMEVDAQSGCIRILTRWIRRRLPDDKDKKKQDIANQENEMDNITINDVKSLKSLKCMRGSEEDNKIIDILLQKEYNNIFKYIKYCNDPHVLANAPLLLKQFIIYAKLNEKNKPYLKKLIKKHSKKKLKDLMALFTNQHVSIIQNSVTCMAQLATFDEDLRDKIREMGGLKAMSQLHMQHRQSLFK